MTNLRKLEAEARALLASADEYEAEVKKAGAWKDRDADSLIIKGIQARLRPALAALDAAEKGASDVE